MAVHSAAQGSVTGSPRTVHYMFTHCFTPDVAFKIAQRKSKHVALADDGCTVYCKREKTPLVPSWHWTDRTELPNALRVIFFRARIGF